MERNILRRPRKTDIDGVDLTCWDRLFQVQVEAIQQTVSYYVQQKPRQYYCTVIQNSKLFWH